MGRGQLGVARDRLRERRAGGEDPRRRAATCRRSRRSSSIDADGDVGDAIALDDAARARPRRATPRSSAERARAVTRDHPYTIIYTSGTTGPPKGCVLSHGNYRDVVTMCEQDAVVREGDVAYLFLPLAHSFALLIQLTSSTSARRSPTSAATRSRSSPSCPRSSRPTCRRSRASSRSSTRWSPPTATPSRSRAATQVGLAVRELQAAGQEVPAELQAHFDAAEEKLFKNVRAAFGGNLRQATSGAAPIAQEILEFFFACGVPVLEGYGMTETATGVDGLDRRQLPLRLGRPRAARPGDPDRRRRRDPAQGPEHLPGLLQERRRVVRRDRRRLAAHRRPRLASTRTATCSSPAARRTSSSPRAART